MPKRIQVPKKVSINAKLFLDSLQNLPDELANSANMVLAERLATGVIDEPTFNALESWSEGINWKAKLDGSNSESNALLSIGGRATKAFIADTIALIEKETDQSMNDLQPDGSYIRRIRIIKPGLGSSGYYPEEALRASEGAFPKGTNMLNSHVRQLERVQKAGLSVDDIFGETIEDAVFENHPEEGPGLYTRIRIFPKVVERLGLDAVRKSQFSIYTQAIVEKGKRMIEGRLVPVVKKLINTRTTSIDAVLIAGRGGAFVAENANGPSAFHVVVESTNGWIDGDCDCEGGSQLCVIAPVLDEFNESGTDSAERNDMTLEEAKARIQVLEAENAAGKAALQADLAEKSTQIESLQSELRGHLAVEAVRTVLAPVKFKDEEARQLVGNSVLHTVKFDENGEIDKEALAVAVEAYTSGTSSLVVVESDEDETSQDTDAGQSFSIPNFGGFTSVESYQINPKSAGTSGDTAPNNSEAAKAYLDQTKDIKF